MGVLMPDKKLLPLNLMPLDIEFTLNPYAMYSSLPMSSGTLMADSQGSRSYIVTNLEMYTHMIFFEQEVHRSLESIVAEHGIFLHFNSFYYAPTT